MAQYEPACIAKPELSESEYGLSLEIGGSFGQNYSRTAMELGRTMTQFLEPKSSDAMRSLLKRLRRRLDPASAKLGEHQRVATRRGKGISQEELAEAIGISRGWYVSLERGTIRPSIALLKRLATVLDATPDERIMLFQLAIPELRGYFDALQMGVASEW